MTNTDAPATTTADAMLAASARRAADYRPVIIDRAPRRDLPIKNRRHSVSHRSYR